MPKPPSLPKPRQQHKPPRQLHLAQCQLLPQPHSRAKAFCHSQAQLLAPSAQPKRTAAQPRHPQQKTSNLPLLPLPRLLLPLPQAPHHHLRQARRPRRISLPPVSLGVAPLASAMSSPRHALLHHHGRCDSSYLADNKLQRPISPRYRPLLILQRAPAPLLQQKVRRGVSPTKYWG